jgi:putative DNA methylase
MAGRRPGYDHSGLDIYTLCERKGWAEDARAYNELVTAWSDIERAAADAGILGSQTQMDI